MKREFITTKDLLNQLETLLELLEEDAKEAFREDGKRLGDVASKLRLLVCDRTDTKSGGLLFRLMDLCEINIFYEGRSIKDYMKENCIAAPLSELPTYNVRSRCDFVRCWAEQFGSAHVDSRIDEDIAKIREFDKKVSGKKLLTDCLDRITTAVLVVGRQFLLKALKS